MNPTGKKFISLFLVFSLLEVGCIFYSHSESRITAVTYQDKKEGAKLGVWAKGDRLIEGELITVKPDSLLLLDAEGKDVSIDIEDIEVIKVGRDKTIRIERMTDLKIQKTLNKQRKKACIRDYRWAQIGQNRLTRGVNREKGISQSPKLLEKLIKHIG